MLKSALLRYMESPLQKTHLKIDTEVFTLLTIGTMDSNAGYSGAQYTEIYGICFETNSYIENEEAIISLKEM